MRNQCYTASTVDRKIQERGIATMENAISDIESLKILAKNAILSLTKEELEMVIKILLEEKEASR